MSSFGILGAGAVGTQAALTLSDSSEVDRIVIIDRQHARAQRLAQRIGGLAEAVAWHADDFPDVDVVLAALPGDQETTAAQLAAHEGVSYVSSCDSEAAIAANLNLAVTAPMVLGCGLVPGFSDVLVQHAVSSFAEVSEIRVARAGVAGPASAANLRTALSGKPQQWRDGELRQIANVSEEVWFPEPVGARDCWPTTLGVELLRRAQPQVRVISSYAEPAPPLYSGKHPRWRRSEEPWGAVRVEVWGTRGNSQETLVYGAVERTSVAAGSLLALVGRHCARGNVSSGIHTVATAVQPVELLSELSERGVKVATFEGVG